MPKQPVFESMWTNIPPDPSYQERWNEMLEMRRPKSPEDIDAARAYAKEFAHFAVSIAETMRDNRSFRTFKFKKTRAVVSKVIEGWWKAEFYRTQTKIESGRWRAVFEPFAFDLFPAGPCAAEMQELMAALAAI